MHRKSAHAYEPVYMHRNPCKTPAATFKALDLRLFISKITFLPITQKPLGLRHFRQFSTPPSTILPPSDLAMTKLLWKFQTPTTPGGRDSRSSVRLSVRSDFSVPLRAKKLKFRTKDAYVTVSRCVKWFFDRTTLRPTIGPRVVSKVGWSLSAAISRYP